MLNTPHKLLPGLLLAIGLAVAGQYLSILVGNRVLGMANSPVSPIMMAIILGMLWRNTIGLPDGFQPGVKFCLVRVLRLGIVLLGIRLSLGEVGAIGLRALPVIVVCIATALVLVTWVSARLGLSKRLGTLIAAGTGICGTTAIVAVSPVVQARGEETSYAIACITVFGVAAMLAYPFIAHQLFQGDAFGAGLFLGTSVHETAQVAGAGLVYQQYYSDAEALDVATVTKLARNLGILVVVPLLGFLYHREVPAAERPSILKMVPLFIIGFALLSLLRTVGDLGDPAFGFLPRESWVEIVGWARHAAEACLAVAMAAVGLGTRFADLRELGVAPFVVGLFSAALVGVVSVSLILVFF